MRRCIYIAIVQEEYTPAPLSVLRELHAALQAHLQQQELTAAAHGGSERSDMAALPPFPSSSVIGGSGGADASAGGAGVGHALATLSGMVFGRGGGDPAVIEVRSSGVGVAELVLASSASPAYHAVAPSSA